MKRPEQRLETVDSNRLRRKDFETHLGNQKSNSQLGVLLTLKFYVEKAWAQLNVPVVVLAEVYVIIPTTVKTASRGWPR